MFKWKISRLVITPCLIEIDNREIWPSKKFLVFAYNPGLKRRFSTYFNIEEYNAEELKEIFYLKLKKFKYENKIDEKKVVDFFKTNHKDFKHFGGDIEKLVNELKYVHANRSFYEDEKDNRDINFIDLKNAYDNFVKNSNKKEEYKPPMGMYI